MIHKQDKKGGKRTGLLLLEVFLKDLTRRARTTCHPNHYAAIDETLYPTRGDILLKTYNKDNPAKYSLSLRNLGSSRRPYFYYTIPYTENR